MIFITGIPFILDGVASEIYGLSMAYIDKSNVYEQESGGIVEFITDENPRNPERLFLGIQQSSVLSFEIDIINENAMDVHKFTYSKDWLFSTRGYRKMQICLDNFDDFVFDCQLKPQKDFVFSDGYRAVRCIVECKSPYAWTNLKTKTYPKVEIFSSVNFDNLSANLEDMLPCIEFKITNNRNFKIINKSYDNLTFEWTNLQDGEIITCDCQTGIITSSTGLNRFVNFNKNFLRFKKGRNKLEFWGNVEYVKIKYKNAVRLGGGMY